VLKDEQKNRQNFDREKINEDQKIGKEIFIQQA
jgi:hypothetical protein